MLPRLPLIAVGVAGLLACSDSSGPSTLSLGQLAGTWDLSRLDMLLASDTTVRQNVIQEYGLHASLTIDRDGATVLTVSMSGSAPDTAYGTIEIHGDTVAYGDYEATVRLHGRTMTWLALETSSWDIDNDGTPEDVLERDVWQRR
jgi:hypothetical protein